MAKVNNTGGKPLQRREVVKALLVDRGDLLVVAGLGAPAWDATEAGDHPLTFPLWGGMGGAVMIGLGLALAQPSRNVLVITGDGEMLMGLGSLATVGVTRPKNLSVVVLDNEVYGETGQQKTHDLGRHCAGRDRAFARRHSCWWGPNVRPGQGVIGANATCIATA
jgi:thiamine pyrophosphate-dependent acetolactate synthase large subunit-like protein